jgi:hypothetical protein
MSTKKKLTKTSDKKQQATLTVFLSKSTFNTSKDFQRPPLNSLTSLSRTPNNFPPQSPYHHHYNDRAFSIFKGCAVRHGQPPLTSQLGYTQQLKGKPLPSHTKQVLARKMYSQIQSRVAYSNTENHYLQSTATCMNYISSSATCMTASTNGVVRCFDARSWMIDQDKRNQSPFITFKWYSQ